MPFLVGFNMIEIIKKHSRLTLVFLALTASPTVLAAQQVNVNVSPTTGYYETTSSTYRVPPTAKVNPIKDVTIPTVEKISGGGLSQKISSGIEITAVKQTAPISAKVKVGAQALKNGSKNLLKGGLAGIVLTAGLEKLLDGIDILIEDGQLVREVPTPIFEAPSGSTWQHAMQRDRNLPGPPGANFLLVQTGVNTSPGKQPNPWRRYCSLGSVGNRFIGYNASNNRCYYLPGAQTDDGYFRESMPDSAIDEVVDNFYEPEPEDWNLLARYVDPSAPDVYAEISNIPSLLMPPTTKTIYDADGNAVEVQETNVWYDFDIIDNNSKQPAIDIKENKETKTYDSEGNLKGTEKTQSTSKAGSSSASSSGNLEIPTDCAFMPTVCAFLDWFKTDTQVEVKEFSEEASTFQERDFFGEPVPTFQESLELMSDGIKNAPIAQALSNISFPTGGSCPTGTTSINIAGKNIQLTFESHCDLWELIAPIISAAFLALWAVIAVRVFLSA